MNHWTDPIDDEIAEALKNKPMKPILKINLDELDKSQLNQLANFLFAIGKTKLAHQVEAYVKAQGL